MDMAKNASPASGPRAHNPFLLIILTSFPIALVTALAWSGTYTFVNGYIVKGLGYSNETWTAASLWFSAGMIFWPILCTEISAKIGRRRTVTLSLIIVSIFYLTLSFTANLFLIRLLLAMAGFVIAANNTAWLPMVAQISREYPGRALTINQVAATVVGIAAMVVGGYVIDHVSYRIGFLLFGSACGACAILYHVISSPFETRDQPKVVTFRKFSRQDLRDLATGPFLTLLIVGIGFGAFNYHTFNQLYPNLVRDFYHFSEKSIGMVVALGRVPALIVLFLLVHRIDRVNVFRTYGLGMALAGLALTAIGLCHGVVPVVGLYFAFYVFHGTVWGTESVSVNALVEPRLRDSAFALMSIAATVAIFGVGLVHNRMLAAGIALPQVFTLCGLAGLAAGGTIVIRSCMKSRSQPVPRAVEA